MTIYDKLVSEVTAGKTYKVDLVNKTMRVGKEVLINEREFEGDLIGDLPCDPWEMLERLYDNFYHSCPGAWSKRDGRYFKAKPGDEMSFIELAQGEPRHIARAKLEAYVLCAVLAGMLKWNQRFGSWFWKSKQHEDFVLLKKWF